VNTCILVSKFFVLEKNVARVVPIISIFLKSFDLFNVDAKLVLYFLPFIFSYLVQNFESKKHRPRLESLLRMDFMLIKIFLVSCSLKKNLGI